MRPQPINIIFILLFLLPRLAFAAPAAQDSEAQLRLINESDQSICGVYVSFVDEDTWIGGFFECDLPFRSHTEGMPESISQVDVSVSRVGLVPGRAIPRSGSKQLSDPNMTGLRFFKTVLRVAPPACSQHSGLLLQILQHTFLHVLELFLFFEAPGFASLFDKLIQ